MNCARMIAHVVRFLNMRSISRVINKMRSIIGCNAFFGINSRLTLLLFLLLLNHSHMVLVSGSSEVVPAAENVHPLYQHAALTSDDSEFFNTNHYLSDTSDVESVPITAGGGIGGNVTIGNGNHAGKYSNWDDYMGSIDMYSETGDYDYGK